MHISEGVLSMPVLVSGWTVAVAGLGIGLKRLDGDQLVTASTLAAAFFIGSLIHIPLGPGNVHLLLNGLLAAVLGWAAIPAIFVCLLLQAVLFQFGGLSILGINTATMALSGVGCWLVLRRFLAMPGKPRVLAAFGIGAGGVCLATLLTAASLAASSEAFLASAAALFIAHIPVMVVEGLVTVAVVQFLCRVRPELLCLPNAPRLAT